MTHPTSIHFDLRIAPAVPCATIAARAELGRGTGWNHPRTRGCPPRSWLAWLRAVGGVAATLGVSTLDAVAATASPSPGSTPPTDTFTQLFPGFIKACAELHDLLVPFALALCVLSFAFAFWHGPLNGPELVRHFCKLFLVIFLITEANDAINNLQAILQGFLEQHVPARAENVAERYKQLLGDAQNAKEKDKGIFERFLGAGFFESIMGAILTLIAWAGMAVTFFVFIVQKIALLLCYTLTPVFFPCFLFPAPLSGLAWRHTLRICGILSWPMALALAATITEGLLDGMVRDQSLLKTPVLGQVGYALSNLLALGVIAIWVIVSSVFFPLMFQRMIGHGGTAASTMLRSADLMANVSLPILAGLFGWGWTHRSGHSSASAHTAQPVPPLSPDTPPPAPSALVAEFAPEPDPSDPTGQRRVEAAFDEFHRPD